jgi:hypothetical protein
LEVGFDAFLCQEVFWQKWIAFSPWQSFLLGRFLLAPLFLFFFFFGFRLLSTFLLLCFVDFLTFFTLLGWRCLKPLHSRYGLR